MKLSFLAGVIFASIGAALFLSAPFVASLGTDQTATEDPDSEDEIESFIIFCPPSIHVEPAIEVRNGAIGVLLILMGTVIAGFEKRRTLSHQWHASPEDLEPALGQVK